MPGMALHWICLISGLCPITSNIDILPRTIWKAILPLFIIHILILQNVNSLAVWVDPMENLTLHYIEFSKMILTTESFVGVALPSECIHFNPGRGKACQNHLFLFGVFSCPDSSIALWTGSMPCSVQAVKGYLGAWLLTPITILTEVHYMCLGKTTNSIITVYPPCRAPM